MIISLEGIDASGKATQSKLLERRISLTGKTVQKISFPRYEETVFGKIAGEYLNGDFGSITSVSPNISALIFAGDRFESLETITKAILEKDIILFDRYVASNLAHQAARVDESGKWAFIEWLDRLEHIDFKLPRPDITVYLDLPVDAALRILGKKEERTYTRKKADIYEENKDYLSKCREVYLDLYEKNFGNEWIKINCVDEDNNLYSPDTISALIWEKIEKMVLSKSLI